MAKRQASNDTRNEPTDTTVLSAATGGVHNRGAATSLVVV